MAHGESLQLDETIGICVATLPNAREHLMLVNNRHPLVPMSTLRAGFRLTLHGLSTEMLHAFLMQQKERVARESASNPLCEHGGCVDATGLHPPPEARP